ncbi:unnamed protein product, partial [Symbiodinium pilosum]
DGLGLICIQGSQSLDLDPEIVVKEVLSEIDLFGALTEVVRAADPAVVLGY